MEWLVTELLQWARKRRQITRLPKATQTVGIRPGVGIGAELPGTVCPWHAAAELGGRVRAPKQYLRSRPERFKDLF